MRACDICPGGASCAGVNLAPLLVRVFDLYAGGKTDKFKILFDLDEDEEELLEIHTTNVSRACWTRATLSAIAEVLARREGSINEGVAWTAVGEKPWDRPKTPTRISHGIFRIWLSKHRNCTKEFLTA